MSLNRVSVSGRLSRDIELKRTQSGTAVTSFTLAVDGDYKDKQTGERPTYWVDCIAWGATAQFMERYLSKFRMVIVDGHLQTRKWQDSAGNKRKATEVVADHVYFGDSKQDLGISNTSHGYHAPPAPQTGEFQELTTDDGTLPF